MLRIFTISFFIFGFIFNSAAQKLTAKLLDKENHLPIPFATIQYSKNEGTMSNEEGDFEFEKPTQIVSQDSVFISSLGFKTKALSLQDSIPTIIYLEEEIFKISPVVLSNKKMEINEIIEKVKQNLSKNYKRSYSTSSLFIRENYRQRIKNFDFTIEKTTIDNINQHLFDSVTDKIPRKFTSLIESSGNLNVKKSEQAKVLVNRALIIQNKHDIASVEGMQEDFMNMLKKNTKPNSYLVIKSGIIRLEKTESIDSIVRFEDKQSKKTEEEKNESIQKNRNNAVNALVKDLFINEDSKVDILKKSNRYVFSKLGFVEIGNDLAYVIDFSPKGKTKYKGKLYVNTEDFAILRAEIFGARKIFDKKINMLGIKANELSFKNVVIFSKENTESYHLKYLKHETSQEVGIKRPIKVIEKNKIVKGRNKQNEVSFDMNIQIHNRTIKELVLTQVEKSTAAAFESFEPKNGVKTTRLNAYDTSFWNGYNILTPEKAIKELKIED